MGIVEDVLIIKVSEDVSVIEDYGIVVFNIFRYNIQEYTKIKNLCKYDEPFDVILIWSSYKNINYGIRLDDFIMENVSGDLAEASTFYGKTQSYRRISNTEYKKYDRKNKIKKILNT
tara:strand:+ start:229 stop:579 length:351 start_codon:yes stop_codon:yes gene_type:complete